MRLETNTHPFNICYHYKNKLISLKSAIGGGLIHEFASSYTIVYILSVMELTQSNIKTMKDLLAKEEFYLPKPGTILQGQIISVSKSSVIVDLGTAGIGIFYPGEFYDNPERMRALKPGETVSAMLIELENEEGYRELSLRSAQM